MFTKLLDKILNNKRNLLFVLVGISLFFILSDNVFAATETSTFADTKKKVWEVMQYLSTMIWVFLALITYLTTMFLSPEWINGSLFWLNTVFKSIWVMVSNLVYLVFAFILIWIAFMNIIWKGWDKYQLKQALPKFVIGILIVPFSWFLVNFILSISAVLTISALNLPFDTFQNYKDKITTVQIPTKCTFNPDNLSSSWTTSSKQDLEKILKCEDWSKKPLTELLESWKSWDSIFWVIALYTYWVVNLETFDNLNESYLSKVTNMAQLVLKLVFDFLFIVIYAVLMIALGLVLMTRWIYLWIYMMMSPVFWLMYFFDKTEWWGWFFEKFNLKQFISLAFVPVLAMLALSFGMLFMFMVWNGMTTPPWPNDPPSTITIEKNTFKINEVSLEIKGSITTDQSITDFFKSVWNDALGVIWALILKIFGVVILWWAMMAALRTNEITKAVVEPLYQFWTKVWEMAKASPQYLPVFGGQSMSSLSTAAWTVSSWIQSIQQKKWSELWQRFLPLDDNAKALRAIADKHSATIDDSLSQFKKANSLAWAEKIANDKHARDAYIRTLTDTNTHNWFKNKSEATELIWKLKDAKTAAEIRKILVDLHNLSIDGKKLFWNVTANEWNIDSLISQNGSWVQQQTPWTPAAWTQTINLNIKNEWLNSNLYKTDSSGKITWVTDAQAVASHISETNLLTREQFIDEFVKKLITEKWRSNITDENARKIAQEVASKITNFKTTP